MIAQSLPTRSVAYPTPSIIDMEISYRRSAFISIPLVRLPIDPKTIVWRLLDRLPLFSVAILAGNGTFATKPNHTYARFCVGTRHACRRSCLHR